MELLMEEMRPKKTSKQPVLKKTFKAHSADNTMEIFLKKIFKHGGCKH